MLDALLQLVGDEPPWWLWAALVIVPICMLLSVREFMCWFWKINKLVSRLEKIERRLNGLQLGTAPIEPKDRDKNVATRVLPPAVHRDAASERSE